MDKTLNIGSISSGTMLDSDLIPVFLDTLEEVDSKRAKSLRWQYRKLLNYYSEERIKPYSDEEVEQLNEDASWLVNEELFNALNEYCPPYTYFGAHPGDGSDFGVWVSDDSIRDDIHDDILTEVNDLCEIDTMINEDRVIPKNVIVVNDHGNMTLYTVLATLEEGDESYKLTWEVNEVWAIV